jgi:hypothetical protein
LTAKQAGTILELVLCTHGARAIRHVDFNMILPTFFCTTPYARTIQKSVRLGSIAIGALLVKQADDIASFDRNLSLATACTYSIFKSVALAN